MESPNEPTKTASLTASQKQPPKAKKDANWRLSILATPTKITPKYKMPPYTFCSGVRPEALKARIKERDIQMAIPTLRRLYVTKRMFTGLPDAEKGFAKNMNKKIEEAWNSIYNEYKKAKRDHRLKELKKREKSKKSKKAKGKKDKGEKKEKGAKKDKGEKKDKGDEKAKGDKKAKGEKKGKGEKKDKGKKKAKGEKKGKDEKKAKKGKEDDTGSVDRDKELAAWIDKSSQPKKIPEPEPINRGPTIDLDEIKGRLDIIATPNMVTEKYVPKRPPKHIVKESALTYIASERVLEISKPAPYRLVKETPIVLGSVSPAALRYKTTDRDTRLATPRARASANDADVKDDPFAISKNALKYKATPRIIELAKPVERK